uniref:Putative membrane protein YOL092W n=1 Tax=Anthurium amnicola TaxID=1678845 RepID=A0A1D1XTN8_9ARAE
MGLLKGSPLPICSANKRCSHWARVYLKHCLCSAKDGMSLTLGLISVVSWGVAEVPQIITNYKEKSTEGLSVAFLTTWMVGDIFNLLGCLLEPATLPTQFYMALLYTGTTALLTGQTIYYGHIYHRLKANQRKKYYEDEEITKKKRAENLTSEISFMDKGDTQNGSSASKEDFQLPSSPIPIDASVTLVCSSSGRNFYYMSARSLSRSPKPIAGSFLAHSRDFGRTPPTSHDQHFTREPLLGEPVFSQSSPPLNTKNMLSVLLSSVFFLGGLSLHLFGTGRLNAPSNNMVILVGRKLLYMENLSVMSTDNNVASSGIGTFLGWAMATIYMGGRLPQICLNMKRGTVEGLNPLMFGFAVVGNATYVASILVSSLDWSRIRPNLPWLVDAGGCVLLDTFILIQFVYFHCRGHKTTESAHEEDCI